MYDVWSGHCGDTKNFTFFSARHDSHSRIKMIFATKSIFDQVENIAIGKRIYLDHTPVLVAWVIHPRVEGVRLWRLDTKKQILAEIVKFFQLNN